ncbi:unnamed protein product [Allacma fusca]|uniref:Elongation of very long chain fatty acids protein n=1 Tax=Allacma fusca TaxID=39272 RepID=A0A8J2P1Y4_9HEXA|nr:unnamed protein product [Allacma fusca]
MCDEFDITKVKIKSEYVEAFDFEVFDALRVHGLVVKYRPVMFCVVGLYLLGIHFGQKWMRNRPAFQLNGLLFFWNISLALFSIMATVRGYPETFHLLSQPRGFYKAVCSQDSTNYATVFWGWLYMLSKIVELGDTAFIILRKQKLIVLHWFHHICMVIGCWIAAEYVPAAGRMYFVNCFVHSFMYSYYALKALKFQIPKRVSMALTMLQIVQMILGVLGVFFTAGMLYLGVPCRLNMHLVYMGATMASAFLALFINFFARTYLQSGKRKIH